MSSSATRSEAAVAAVPKSSTYVISEVPRPGEATLAAESTWRLKINHAMAISAVTGTRLNACSRMRGLGCEK